MTSSTWVLMLFLANGEYGPVIGIDPYTCRLVELRIASGLAVLGERMDGSAMWIDRARCYRTEVASRAAAAN